MSQYAYGVTETSLMQKRQLKPVHEISVELFERVAVEQYRYVSHGIDMAVEIDVVVFEGIFSIRNVCFQCLGVSIAFRSKIRENFRMFCLRSYGAGFSVYRFIRQREVCKTEIIVGGHVKHLSLIHISEPTRL